MRRKNPSELVISAPSKGVITYVPSNQPEKDSGRAATYARNVRFDRGVARSAPGSVAVALTGDALDSAISLVVQPGLSSDFQAFAGFSMIIGTGFNLYQGFLSGSFLADGVTPNLSLALTRIYAGVQGFVPWRATAFFDKAVVCNGAVIPQWWNGSYEALPIPGLPQSYYPDGCENIANHLMFWKGRRGHWSELGDYSLFIPVRDPACTGRWKPVHAISLPAPDQVTDWIYLDDSTAKMAKGQFFRIEDLLNGQASYYDVFDLSPINAQGQLTTAGFAQAVSSGFASSKIYLDNLLGVFPTGVHLQFDGGDWTKVVQLDQSSRSIQAPLFTAFESPLDANGVPFFQASFTAPAIGSTIQISVGAVDTFDVGDQVSISNTGPATCSDIYTVMSIDRVAVKITIRREGIGTNQQSSYSNLNTTISFQPWVSLRQIVQGSYTGTLPTGFPDIAIPAGAVFRPVYGIRLHNQDKTGAIPAGTSYIPYGVEFEALGTNDAGEFVQTGGYDEHGDILQIVRINENDGLMLKERGIASIKYVGRPEIFNISFEMTDEGLIDPGAWTRLANNTIAFLGHRGFYIYTAGGGVKPICETVMRSLYEELDRSAFNRIRIIHDENNRELHLYYPTLAGVEKVLIYSYIEDSVSFDDYAPLAVRTAGLAQWSVFENWNSDASPIPWTQFTKRWSDNDSSFALPLANIIAYSSSPTDFSGAGCKLYAYGFTDDRAGVAFHKEFQSIDYDFSDSSAFKYLDTVTLSLEIKKVYGSERTLWVQAGARDSLDAQIRWGTPQPIDCSGNRNDRPRVNLRRSGRYLRLKFYSDDPDCQWRISEYRLIARLGGTL